MSAQSSSKDEGLGKSAAPHDESVISADSSRDGRQRRWCFIFCSSWKTIRTAKYFMQTKQREPSLSNRPSFLYSASRCCQVFGRLSYSVIVNSSCAGWDLKKVFKETGINSTKHKQWKNRLESAGKGCHNNKLSNIEVLIKKQRNWKYICKRKYLCLS